MNHDAVFIKGYSHEICEDYAYSTKYKAVISDGCSSAENTDIGSRIVARTNTIENALDIANKMSLDEESITATKLSLELLEDKTLQVDIKGDGFLIYKDLENNIILEEYNFVSNAPYYPAYDLNKDRKKLWLENFDNTLEIKKYINFILDENQLLPIQVDEKFKGIEKTIKDYQWCFIGSDGVFSFNTEIVNVLKELTNFKLKNGCFLKRRINKMIKKFNKEGIKNFDDIAIAGFWL